MRRKSAETIKTNQSAKNLLNPAKNESLIYYFMPFLHKIVIVPYMVASQLQ